MQAPTTLKQLYKIAARPLWRGKSYEMTACRNVEQFIELVGDLPLGEVKTTTVDAFIAALEGKVSDATINRKLSNVSSLLKYAADRDWILKMPKLEWKQETEGRIRWITPAEETTMLALLAAWGEHEVSRFIVVLLETGLRRGELLGLEAKNVDGPWIRLWVNKTKKPRSVPLSPKAQAALSEGLFQGITEGKLRIVWKRLKDSMGLQNDDDFVLHTLRHTAATRTLARTGNVAIVQKLLGHRKIETTMRYAHIADEELLAAVNAG